MTRRRAALSMVALGAVCSPYVVVAIAAGERGAHQIPERAQWEITFAQVEAAAELPDLRTARSETVEARVMQRPWSAIAPLPFLRIVQANRTVAAQLFLFWDPRRYPPGKQPAGRGVVCRDGVCVRPVDLREQRDWGEVIASLVSHDACPPRALNACGDCDQLWIKTAAGGTYREQSCQQPASDTLAGSLLQLMTRSVRPPG